MSPQTQPKITAQPTFAPNLPGVRTLLHSLLSVQGLRLFVVVFLALLFQKTVARYFKALRLRRQMEVTQKILVLIGGNRDDFDMMSQYLHLVDECMAKVFVCGVIEAYTLASVLFFFGDLEHAVVSAWNGAEWLGARMAEGKRKLVNWSQERSGQ